MCDFERNSIEAEKNGIDNEGWTPLGPPQLLQVYIFNRWFSIFINQQRSILCLYESDVVLVRAGSSKKPKTSGPTIY